MKTSNAIVQVYSIEMSARKKRRTNIEPNKSFSTKNIIEFIGFIISKIDMDGKAVNVCCKLELVQVTHNISTRGFALWPILVHIFNKKKSSFEQIAICEILFLLIAFYYFPFDCLMLMSMRHRILCIHLFFFISFFQRCH